MATLSTANSGERSPLARLYDLDARVLLLGVGHGNNTSMHLAEYRANWAGKKLRATGSPVTIDGTRQWFECEDLDLDDGDFPVIGDAFDATGAQIHGTVGAAGCLLMPIRAVVDFAAAWMNVNRRAAAPT
jgi:aminoglycoside 3-N-acetyltransferase